MEKIIYALWKDGGDDRAAFNTHLREKTGPALCDKALSVRLNLQDEFVSGGTSPRAKATDPQMDAIIQLWVDSANDSLRAPIDALIGAACSRFEAWLVSESTAIKNTQYPPETGQRTEGFSQMVFLKRPDGMVWDEWRQHWHDTHTKVAIETQSNFEYHQNLVTRQSMGITNPKSYPVLRSASLSKLSIMRMPQNRRPSTLPVPCRSGLSLTALSF